MTNEAYITQDGIASIILFLSPRNERKRYSDCYENISFTALITIFLMKLWKVLYQKFKIYRIIP